MICYRYRTLSLRLMLLAAICMPVAYDISATPAVSTANLPLYFEANHGQADPSSPWQKSDFSGGSTATGRLNCGYKLAHFATQSRGQAAPPTSERLETAK